ncbi:hypothetical protein [Paenibacillus naphthalenovorans]|nr:hypothetical protein [Paenibacillus naphthalenovorans]
MYIRRIAARHGDASRRKRAKYAAWHGAAETAEGVIGIVNRQQNDV